MDGEDKLKEYAAEKHGFGLAFCGVCGSTLCGTFEGMIHGVTLGCLNENPEIDEIHHIFVDSKAAWDVIPSGVRMFSEGRCSEDRR